jgi:hypothetical protein
MLERMPNPLFQSVLKDIRDKVNIHPGQEYQVIAKGGIISLVPDRPIASMRGREKSDKF